jgi:hypothetical protein
MSFGEDINEIVELHRSGHEATRRFLEVIVEAVMLSASKQKDYGSDVDPFANIRASQRWGIEPWVGACVRAGDKQHRLERFAEKGVLANESARDSMLDNVVYYAIAAVLYDEASTRVGGGTPGAPDVAGRRNLGSGATQCPERHGAYHCQGIVGHAGRHQRNDGAFFE